jgi:WD40 repeat protein
MPGLTDQPAAASYLGETRSHVLDDYALDARWSPDGTRLAAVPSQGSIVLLDATGAPVGELPAHRGGNTSLAWHPAEPVLATIGQDSVLRLHSAPFGRSTREITLPSGWCERVAWSPDGSRIAVTCGRRVLVLDAGSGEAAATFTDHRSTVTDIAWNPTRGDQFAAVCDGGAKIWRLGKKSPSGHFDWGGASLLVTWSPDGRWVVTGDQTPSVHLYDTTRKTPLHIQGFESKVKCFAWADRGERLATGGGSVITLWPCTGRKGPDGATPIQLAGHLGEVRTMDFFPGRPVLASGGADGLVLVWLPLQHSGPALLAKSESEITAVRWNPQAFVMAYTTSAGEVAIGTLRTAAASGS